jgi:hypothetical protein
LENNHKLVWLTQNWIWFSRSKSEYFVWIFFLKLDSSSIYVWNQNCSNLFFRTGTFFIKVKNHPTLVLIHSSSRRIRSNYHLALVFYPYVGQHHLFSHFEVCVGYNSRWLLWWYSRTGVVLWGSFWNKVSKMS